MQFKKDQTKSERPKPNGWQRQAGFAVVVPGKLFPNKRAFTLPGLGTKLEAWLPITTRRNL
jgi:hypothetical protein